MADLRTASVFSRRCLRRRLRWLAVLGLAVVSLLYCWPGHPSAHGLASDGLAHVLLFMGMGPLCWFCVRRWPGAVLLAGGLGLVLELVQWRLGGYAQVEWADVAANGLGAAMGLGLAGPARAVMRMRHCHAPVGLAITKTRWVVSKKAEGVHVTQIVSSETQEHRR